MKRVLSLLLAAALLCACVPVLADDGGSGSTLLRSLTHNCPNTGIMLPEHFSPYQTTYLLTVASWVSRPTFTPTAAPASAGVQSPVTLLLLGCGGLFLGLLTAMVVALIRRKR